MKTSFSVKLVSLLLALLMVSAILIACKENEEPPSGTEDPAASDTASGSVSESDTEYVEVAPEVIDTDGYEYIIYCKDNKLWFEMYACEAGSQTGDTISDALYARETLIEDLYKCEITLVKDDKIKDKITINNTLGGSAADHLADIIFTTGKDTLNLAMIGALENVLDLENLQLQNSYWDQNIQTEYKIGNALYCLEGDINVRDDLRTMQVTFNKELYNTYNLDEQYGDIYKLVRDKKWTFDTMMEMCKDLYEDPDQNGQSMDDTYGILSEGTAPYYFFLGSGKKPVTNDNGKLTLHLDDEAILEYVDKTLVLGYDTTSCVVNNGKILGMTSTWDDAITLFKNDQALFRSSALSSVNGYVDMKSDYGILPIPMMTEATGRYYCWTASGNHYPVSIPADGIKDYDTSTLITEALAFYSKYAEVDNYNEAFYEKLGDYRLGKTPEDAEMLDIIFASKTYELDQPLVITKVENQMYQYTKAGYSDSMKSAIDAMKDASKIKADEITEAFAKIERANNG